MLFFRFITLIFCCVYIVTSPAFCETKSPKNYAVYLLYHYDKALSDPDFQKSQAEISNLARMKDLKGLSLYIDSIKADRRKGKDIDLQDSLLINAAFELDWFSTDRDDINKAHQVATDILDRNNAAFDTSFHILRMIDELNGKYWSANKLEKDQLLSDRRKNAEYWLKTLVRINKAIDPNFDPKRDIVINSNVLQEPSLDPKVNQKREKERKIQDDINHQRSLQFELLRFREDYIDNLIKNLSLSYTYPTVDPAELESLLNTYKVDTDIRAKILDALKHEPVKPITK